jgi:thymidylate synthase
MKQYLNLLQAIKDKGTLKTPARENMPSTVSLFGHQLRHDLSEGFPLLTTKKLSFKNIVTELLWFLRGDTNVKYLIDNGCNIWNEDAYNYYKKITGDEDFVTFERFVDDIKSNPISHLKHIKYRNYTLGDCGFQYGKVWRDWGESPNIFDETRDFVQAGVSGVDQIEKLINGLKNNPQSRRHIVTAVDPSNETNLALYWCHSMFQFNCRPLTFFERVALMYKPDAISTSGDLSLVEESLDEANIPKYYLDCQMYQRSADVFLGVPYNIASYALLTHIIAQMVNMIPGEYIHTFGDVHIYDNHMDQVDEQLNRKPKKLPKLVLPDFSHSIGSFDTKIEHVVPSDFDLENYEAHPRIKGKLSTGLK